MREPTDQLSDINDLDRPENSKTKIANKESEVRQLKTLSYDSYE